jgi:hypothetical protein
VGQAHSPAGQTLHFSNNNAERLFLKNMFSGTLILGLAKSSNQAMHQQMCDSLALDISAGMPHLFAYMHTG